MNYNLQKTIYMLSRYFLFAFLFQLIFINLALAVDVHAQYKSIEDVKVKLDKKRLTLGEFFNQIEEKSNFQFAYDKQDINKDFSVVFDQRWGSVESYLMQVAISR